jgi:hypothetical protein
VNADGLGNEGWILLCLAVMAVALVAMAIGQVVLALTAAKVARQATDSLQQFQRDLRPIIDKVHKITDDASKTTALVSVQLERIDHMLESSARRVDETLEVVQGFVSGPLRQGSAVVAGVKAAVEIFRSMSERRARTREEEDALFIG